MKMFSAWVKNKKTKKSERIDMEYPNKSKFIADLKSNGYAVNPDMVKEFDLFNFILRKTNADKVDWKYINKIPSENESASDMVAAGLNKTISKIKKYNINKGY